MKANDWYDSREWTYTFGRLLWTAGVLMEVEDVFYYFEKPWKWTTEHEAYVTAGRPHEDGPGWKEWLKVLEDLAAG